MVSGYDIGTKEHTLKQYKRGNVGTMRFLFIIICLFSMAGCNQEKVVVNDRPKPPPTEEQQRYVAGEIIVRFHDNYSEQRINSLLKIHGASIKKKLPGKKQYLIKLPFGHTVNNAVPLYDGLPGVIWAEPNYIFRKMGSPKIKEPGIKGKGKKPVKVIPIRKVN